MADLVSELSRCWRELGGLLSSRRLLDSAETRSGLTPTKLRALDLLAESGGLRVGDLAERACIEETTATRLVDRLERMGAARREPVPGDRRATRVVLTPHGVRLVAAAAQRRHEFFGDVLDALDPAERSELVRLTAKATAALRARSEELVAR